MNNVFNINRFGKYFTTDLYSSVKASWISYLTVMLVPVFIWLIVGFFGLILKGSWVTGDYVFRIIFSLSIFLITILMPVMIYGKVTKKNYGTSFLMVPASVLEKTVSMIVISAIVLPVISISGYLMADWLVCLIDPEAGRPLWDLSLLHEKIAQLEGVPEKYIASFSVLLNPLIYVDDLIGTILVFLLGGLCFKKNPIAKTILVLIGFSILSSSIATPIVQNYFGDLSITPLNAADVLDSHEWLFTHLGLLDTINDTIVNLLLCGGIYLRLKTIKH